MNREPGWYRDPYFRNRERFWDGEAWSEQTRDPAGGTGPALPAAGTTSGASTEGTGSMAPPAQPARPPADPAPPTASGAPAVEGARPVPLGVITASGAPTAAKGRGGLGGRRGLIVAVVAVVVLFGAGVGFILAGGNGGNGGSGGNSGNSGNSGGSGGGGATASAVGVTGAVKKTLHAGTVEAAVLVTVSSAGGSSLQQILSGTGAFQLEDDTGTMSLNVPGAPTAEASTQMVFVGSTVYVYLGAQLSALVPGKTWISATPAELGSPSSGLTSGISAFEQLLGNPVALVQQLNAGSTRFTALGVSTLDGTRVQGYLVKLSPTASSSAGTSSLGTATAGTHAAENLYVASNGQVKAIVIPVEVSSNGETFRESIHIVFSHYGHPVTVTPPPPSEVATLAQYQAALDQTTPDPGSGGGTSPSVSPVGGVASGSQAG